MSGRGMSGGICPRGVHVQEGNVLHSSVYRLRVNFVGESRCGKTSLLRCLMIDDGASMSTPPATDAVDSFLWQPFTTHRHLENGKLPSLQ